MRVLSGHQFQVRRLIFSPDSRRLLACSGVSSHEARLWDVHTGKFGWAIKGDAFGGAAFTADGTGVILADFLNPPSVLDVETLTLTAVTGHPDHIPRLAAMPVVSPDGTLVAGWGRLGVGDIVPGWWQYPDWNWLPPVSEEIWLSGLEKWTFSADGRTIADLASVGSPKVTVREVKTGRIVSEFPFEMKQGMAALAFHPDGERLAVASGNLLRVVEVGGGRDVVTLKQPKKYFLGVTFTPDGRYLGTVSNEASVKLYDTSDWRLAREYDWQVGGLKCLTFSPDGLLGAAAGDKKKVVVFDLDG